MLNILLFDTETTGLPTRRGISALESPDIWPNLLSISWMICNGPTLIRQESYIIRPDGWTIPADSIRIHGITQARAMDDGKPLATVLEHFTRDLKCADRVIAHNMEFDRNVLFHAYKWNLNQNPLAFWNPLCEFCSMNASKPELKLPSKFQFARDPYKNPGLDELYRATFDGKEPPKDAHNASRDVQVLHAIVCKRWPLSIV